MKKLICILGASLALAVSCLSFAENAKEPALLGDELFSLGFMSENIQAVVSHNDHTIQGSDELQLQPRLVLVQFETFDYFSLDVPLESLASSVSGEMIFKSSHAQVGHRLKSFSTRPTVTNHLDVESSSFGLLFG